MRLLALLVLAAVALAVVPPGAAQPADELCVIRYTPSYNFEEVVVTADLVLDNTTRDKLVQEVDADQDGNITAAEVQDYENRSRTWEDRHEALGAKKLFLDGWAPELVLLERNLVGFEGPAEDAVDGLVQEIRTYHYTDFESDWYHFLHGGLYSAETERVAIEFVVLESPRGWVVYRVNGEVVNNATVQLPTFDTQAEYEVVYAREGKVPPDGLDTVIGDENPFIPSIGPAWVLLLAAAVALVRRRTG